MHSGYARADVHGGSKGTELALMHAGRLTAGGSATAADALTASASPVKTVLHEMRTRKR